MSEGAAGLDLSALPDGELGGEIVLGAGCRAVVPTGIAVAIPAGYEGQIRPRSGLAARRGVTCLNSPGTIDSDYRGEVKVILINHGSDPVVIKRGDRIAQLVIAPVAQPVVEVVVQLDDTQRGQDGFGSTGFSSSPEQKRP
ncbi:MAG: dUTP diphosphatase [Pseudomonadota bacterium]